MAAHGAQGQVVALGGGGRIDGGEVTLFKHAPKNFVQHVVRQLVNDDGGVVSHGVGVWVWVGRRGLGVDVGGWVG